MSVFSWATRLGEKRVSLLGICLSKLSSVVQELAGWVKEGRMGFEAELTWTDGRVWNMAQEVLDGLEIPFEIRVLLEVVPSVTHVRVEGIGARALSPRFPLSTPLKLTDLLCSESSLLTSFNADASLKPWTETSYAA
ncbi:hypothetical protein VTJ04DRAFT_1629 [Mycothermus thermophilus]|uniref:uncharacterized protein n=1 Tax=Humicola insolens TaxID=85995 RepID=UPI003742327B